MNIQNFYLDQSLAGVASGFSDGNLVIEQVFLPVPHTKQSGYIYDIDPELRDLIPLDNVRGPGGEPNRMGYDDPARTSFFCDDHALEGFIPIELVKQYDSEAEAAIISVNRVVRNIMLKQEVEGVALLDTMSAAGDPAVKWDHADGDMIADLKAKKETIRLAVGTSPNAIVIPQAVIDEITETPKFKARVQATMTPRQIEAAGDKDLIAALLSIPVENVIVPDAMKNTARIGQSASLASIWGQRVLWFVKQNPKGAQKSQNLGLTVNWKSGESGQAVGGFEVMREQIMRRKGEAVYVGKYYDLMFLNSNAGYLFTNVLT